MFQIKHNENIGDEFYCIKKDSKSKYAKCDESRVIQNKCSTELEIHHRVSILITIDPRTYARPDATSATTTVSIPE